MFNANRQNEFLEQLSMAYIRAIAAAAGCSFSRPEIDQKSTDIILTAPLLSSPFIT
jgi:capsid protein